MAVSPAQYRQTLLCMRNLLGQANFERQRADVELLVAQAMSDGKPPKTVLTECYKATAGRAPETMRSHKHELRLGTVKVGSIMGHDLDAFRLLINPTSSHRSTYIIMSRARAVDGEAASSVFRWNFTNSGPVGANSINVAMPIRDIVQIKSFEFLLSRQCMFTPATVMQSYVTMAIAELRSQACIGPLGFSYHMMGQFRNDSVQFKQKYDGDGDLTDGRDNAHCRSGYFNEGIYRFNPPITELLALTLSFGQPFTPLVFPVSTFAATFDNSTQYIDSIIVPGDLTAYQFGEPWSHVASIVGSTPNMGAFISTFTTSNPDADHIIISLVNRADGFVYDISVAGAGPSTVTLSLIDRGVPLNMPEWSALVGVPVLTIAIYFDKASFMIPMEITYKNPQLAHVVDDLGVINPY